MGNETQNETEQNGTPNGTPENSKDFDVKGYVDGIKERLHPSRARDRDYMAFQLSQIDEHLGGLVE